MKKNYLSMLTVMMAAMLSVCFVSCNKNDDGGGGGNVVSKEAEKFAGAWEGSPDFIFLPNNLCCGDYGLSLGANMYEWTYDENTKQLATTYDGNSWYISIVTDDSWTGVSAKSGESLTYKRNNAYYLNEFMGMFEMFDKSVHVVLPYGIHSHDIPNKNIEIKANTIKTTTNIEITIGEELYKGNITIDNCGKKNAKMTVDASNVSTNEKYKKEYSAKYYIKDKKVVSVEE